MAHAKREASIHYAGRIPSVKEACEDIKGFIDNHRREPGTWTLKMYFDSLKKDSKDKILELSIRACLPPCSWYCSSVESDHIVFKVFVSQKYKSTLL